jgi:hypothetical protein
MTAGVKTTESGPAPTSALSKGEAPLDTLVSEPDAHLPDAMGGGQ